MKSAILGLLVFFVAQSSFAAGNEFPIQLRLFGGAVNTTLTDLNTELRSQGLAEFGTTPKIGLEATYKVAKFFDFGINYSKRAHFKEEATPDPATEYAAYLDQDVILVVGRVPFIKTDLLTADIFAGVGGSNTSLKLKSASQDGELSKKEGGDWVASLATAAGLSIGVGYKWIYLFAEGGYESNKVDGFKRTGNISPNITSLDFTGPYVAIGLIIDGIPAHK